MMISQKQNDEPQVVALQVIWRNPLALVRARLRASQASDPYYRWAEQASKICARRANWDANHVWVA
jgi:hypothetical protein